MVSTISERLYPQEFPNPGDLVVAKIKKIEDDIVYCTLLEYFREGMIPINELSKKKVYSIRQHIRVGAIEVLDVTEVDENKGYIDLSKKRIKSTDIETAKARYFTAKRVWTFFRRWSQILDQNFIETVLWPQYDPNLGYAKVLENIEWINEHQLPEKLLQDFNKHFSEKEERVEVIFEMACLDGVDGITNVLSVIDSVTELPVQLVYTGSTGEHGTKYVLSCTTNLPDAREKLYAIVEDIKQRISKYNHTFGLVKK